MNNYYIQSSEVMFFVQTWSKSVFQNEQWPHKKAVITNESCLLLELS